MEALAILLILVISVVFSLLYVYIPWVAIRWFLATLIPFLIADLYYWTPVIFEGKDSSEYGSWVLIFLFIWYLPSYLASIAILFLMRHRHRLAFKRRMQEPLEQVASTEPITSQALETSNSRVTLGFILAAVTAGLLQNLGSPVSDVVGGVIVALLLIFIFGFPLYMLHKLMGWTTFRNVVTGGAALGAVLAIMFLGILGPELWSSWGSENRSDHYLTSIMIITRTVAGSAVFWVISLAPLKQLMRRISKA